MPGYTPLLLKAPPVRHSGVYGDIQLSTVLHWKQIVSQLLVAPLIVIFCCFHHNFPPMSRCHLVRWLVWGHVLIGVLRCSIWLLLSFICLGLQLERGACCLSFGSLQRVCCVSKDTTLPTSADIVQLAGRPDQSGMPIAVQHCRWASSAQHNRPQGMSEQNGCKQPTVSTR
jgi:hypothetical protein